MKSFIGTFKAQQRHRYDSEESVTITMTRPPTLYWVENIESVSIYLDLHKTRFPLFSKNKPKHFTSLFSPHTKDWNLWGQYGKPETCWTWTPRWEACRHSDAGQPVAFYANVAHDDFHCGKNSDAQGQCVTGTGAAHHTLQRDSELALSEKHKSEQYLFLR